MRRRDLAALTVIIGLTIGGGGGTRSGPIRPDGAAADPAP